MWLMNKYEKISEILKALSHPVRLQIIEGLIKNECNVSEIQKILKLPQSTVSQHLRILKNAGIIKGRRNGTMKVGSLTVKGGGSIYVLWTNLGPHKSIPGGFIGDVNIYSSSGKIED